MFRCLLIGFLLCGLAGARAGELAWKENVITHAAKATDKRATAVFAFTNTSSAPVTIRKVSTSCGCTTAEPSSKTVQPGESGTLETVFTFGGRKGAQRKTIIVQTRGLADSSDVLAFQVEIPDAVRVDKPELAWKAGGPADARAFEITVDDPATTRVRGVKAPGGLFAAELQEVEPGRRYRVLVTPAGTQAPGKATLKLEFTDPMPRSVPLRVAIQP